MLKGECPKCHAINQQFRVFDGDDKQWYRECILCNWRQPETDLILNDSRELRHRYDVSTTELQSPNMCSCVIYNTIPMFQKQSFLGQERRI